MYSYCASLRLIVISKILVSLGILDIYLDVIPFTITMHLNACIVTDESLNVL